MRGMSGQRRLQAGTRRKLLVLGGLALLLLPALAHFPALQADDELDAPINYLSTTPHDPISRLQERIDRGEVRLQKDPIRGYLPSVLRQLNIPLSSQTLVFSKTSLQRDKISPNTPRALYYNDQTYVGWVPGGEIVEVATIDPQLGTVFYVLPQEVSGTPKFIRQTHECLSCHQSSLTGGIPGLTMRSVYPGKDGNPQLQFGSFVTTDESPMKERWGGWYVTGKHGAQRHMGNLTVSVNDDPDHLNREPGANITNLKPFLDTSAYLTGHSDIVALLVAEHQTGISNLLIRANHETRKALHFEQLLNRDLNRPASFRSESTTSRIKSACEPLVRAMLFSNESRLTAPVTGTTPFARDFALAGPKDPQGRSLRTLDLKTRLFRYPCSYLIYSDAFHGLPAESKEYVYRRLWEVLDGRDAAKEWSHLTPADRLAVREILLATDPGFAAAKPKV